MVLAKKKFGVFLSIIPLWNANCRVSRIRTKLFVSSRGLWHKSPPNHNNKTCRETSKVALWVRSGWWWEPHWTSSPDQWYTVCWYVCMHMEKWCVIGSNTQYLAFLHSKPPTSSQTCISKRATRTRLSYNMKNSGKQRETDIFHSSHIVYSNGAHLWWTWTPANCIVLLVVVPLCDVIGDPSIAISHHLSMLGPPSPLLVVAVVVDVHDDGTSADVVDSMCITVSWLVTHDTISRTQHHHQKHHDKIVCWFLRSTSFPGW